MTPSPQKLDLSPRFLSAEFVTQNAFMNKKGFMARISGERYRS